MPLLYRLFGPVEPVRLQAALDAVVRERFSSHILFTALGSHYRAATSVSTVEVDRSRTGRVA